MAEGLQETLLRRTVIRIVIGVITELRAGTGKVQAERTTSKTVKRW